ncbi:LacI family DNA-binding transcriptional regulator [Chelatococcus sp. SYSU_G07232]|uniref:LacI family DNA-binding transcriptional regulator n=1 Tax=Chelatococcus albus TaxID=3047466 RepID=A0ABT7AMD4_9HYPH|nr:LacI family DNA-binding transcriptional regulator [Chelatococcus sp. SYSU_G07232]MDJ1160117.1 LacI family DNA-binding transcriptional regulator [Chelatococcus sp. SYSU_G07232]
MRDVSRLAGVSTMTVSRVLADPELVSEETRSRVLAAIEQLGYLPNRIAGSLSSQRTNFVTAILPTLTNVNFADTAQGLTEALRAADYQLLIGYTTYRIEEEERLIRAMLPRRPDAIVVAGTVHTKAASQLLLRADVPVVEIWETPAHPINHAVGFSNYEAGRAAARYLLSLGHRHIAAVGPSTTGEARDFRGEDRLAGFAAVLREAGIGGGLVVQHGDVPASFDHGARALGVLLDRAPDVEAVFAVSDLSAVGVLMECHRRGIRVPQDLSLVGFGDFDIGRQVVPALTTIRVDAHLIGQRTGELLVTLLDEAAAGAEPAVVDVGFSLVERGTTAPAAPRRRSRRDH